MIYVALLRGINVGGKARVEMKKLKKLFDNLGCGDVSTYINSGNVIFSDTRSAEQLVPLIEAAIEEHFGFSVRVILRDLANIQQLCEKIPNSWTNDDKQKTDVMFLWDEINDASILEKIAINPEIEHAQYIEGALVWNIGRANVTRGGGVKLIKTDFYRRMTVRNVNTVRTILTLMTAAG